MIIMKHDYLLREAEKALNEKNYNKASKKYEEFADRYRDTEPKVSAFHYKLAAKYMISEISKIALYEKVADLFKEANQQENQADVLMDIGLAYQKISNKNKSKTNFKNAIKIYSKLIALLIDESNYSDIANCLEKIKFCINNIDGEDKKNEN